ncbi:MAG: peptide chain release factor 1 [Gammaproteobacteria bacterium]|nr:MAG: peptide chain release factor 1 [Gammaproteobacteria bacterium]
MAGVEQQLLARLESLHERHGELAALLADPEVIGDSDRFRALSKEYSELTPLARAWDRYRQLHGELEEAHVLLAGEDPELRALAREEIARLEAECEALEDELRRLLTPRDPYETGSLFLEIRAGTGGDEAALFAADLLRMYLRYAERKGWKSEIVSASENELGGYREVVVRIAGKGVWSHLRFESGVHRVQRVPATESQGRIHTSACTVAVMPEVEDLPDIELRPEDLRVDTFRASGAGGQHVNKTDSAIRITHLPTGIVVECQDERSQHKNRARAMGLLKARLLDRELQRRRQAEADDRRRQVGSGDRSERIRTYNYPQGRVTDHRINLTLYQLEAVLDGDLDPVIEPLMAARQAEELSALGETG